MHCSIFRHLMNEQTVACSEVCNVFCYTVIKVINSGSPGIDEVVLAETCHPCWLSYN